MEMNVMEMKKTIISNHKLENAEELVCQGVPG